MERSCEKKKRYEEVARKIVNFMRSSITHEESPDIIKRKWDELALELFILQSEFVESYKNLCAYRFKGGRMDICIEKLWQIPSMPASAFKDFEVTSLENYERTTIFYSSGTTYQKPSRHFHSDFSLKIYEESLALWFDYCIFRRYFDGPNLSLNDVEGANTASGYRSCGKANFVFLTPQPENAPNSSLVHMFETLRIRFGDAASGFYGYTENQTSWKIDFERLQKVLVSPGKGSAPVIICGTAFNFVHLIEHFENKGVRFHLPPHAIVFETGGYKGRSREISKSELYTKISNLFGIHESQIISEYGMSELSSQAYDRIFYGDNAGLRKFKFPPWTKFLIVSPDSKEPAGINETGLLRVYDLANVYSVFAIQTDDLAVNLGDGFMLVGRAGAAETRGCSLMVEN